MHINILGTESLGVRGLCCLVELSGRKILIDPGVALGWSRHRFLPHPFQVAGKDCIRYRMIEKGEYPPDAMLPDGRINNRLQSGCGEKITGEVSC